MDVAGLGRVIIIIAVILFAIGLLLLVSIILTILVNIFFRNFR